MLFAITAGMSGAASGLVAVWLTIRGASRDKLIWATLFAVITGVLAVIGLRRLHGSVGFLVLLLQLGVLTHVAIHDAQQRIVLNAVTYPGSAAALLTAPLSPGLTWASALAGAIFAAAPFLITALLRPKGLGMGDVKLAFMVGAMAGLFPGFRIMFALGLSLGAALLTALVLIARRRATRQTPLPFGSFLAVAAMVTLATLNP